MESINYSLSQYSRFSNPITDTTPYTTNTILDTFRYITGGEAKERTEHLRSIKDAKEARMFKAKFFESCTFSGIFEQRKESGLLLHSQLICFDFDHLKMLEKVRQQLLNDEYLETQLLFRSPSGDGLKWIVGINTSTASHAEYFRAIANYLRLTYSIEVDKSGKDVCRACFLPHDPDCFINPNILYHEEERISR